MGWCLWFVGVVVVSVASAGFTGLMFNDNNDMSEQRLATATVGFGVFGLFMMMTGLAFGIINSAPGAH